MLEEAILTPKYILADIETQNYDDFWFTFETNEDGSFKKAKFKWKRLDPAIWQWIFLMRGELIKAHRKERDQYRKKIDACIKREQYKERMKEQEEIFAKTKDHLQEHIRKSEAKLAEYKNVILAFWKLATCNSISK